MRRRILLILVLAVAVGLLATRGIPAPTPNPPGTFSFAALGDGPYYALHGEMLRYRLVRQELAAHDLTLVLHLGDILDGSCAEARYRRTLDQFNALPHPVIYTPGDNEWTDCWTRGSGSFDPLDRLTQLRQIFRATPSQSLGGRRVPVASQAGDDRFGDFVEHVRWTHQDVVFATVNLPGSWNGREKFPGYTDKHDEAATRRTAAAVAWLRDTFAQARETRATAVVIGFHANPGFASPVVDEYRQTYEPFLTALEEEVEQFGKRVLMAHGDTHEFRVDQPLVRRTTGIRLDNLTRLEVPGSPDIGWVRVVVTPGSETTFTFENRVVPMWKVW